MKKEKRKEEEEKKKRITWKKQLKIVKFIIQANKMPKTVKQQQNQTREKEKPNSYSGL